MCRCNAKGGYAVTKSDATRFPPSLIYSHGAGNLVLVCEDGSEVTIPVLMNQTLPLQVIGVKAATTVTSMTRLEL